MLSIALVLALTGQVSHPSSSGTWMSEGYGLVYEIGGGSLEIFEVSRVSCLPAASATAVPAPPEARGAFRLTNQPNTLLLLPDGDRDRMRVHVGWAASDVVLRRIEGKPAVCDERTPDTPPSNFETFVETWAEQYPFFSMKRADWPAIAAENRTRITESTTPEELFAVLEAMIAPLDDAHTFIGAASIEKRFGGSRKTASWIDWKERDRAYALSARYLTHPLRSFCEGQLEFGMLRPDVGYLRLRSFRRFGLPNERFVTDGRSFDGPGIAPDVTVLSFTPEGVSSGRDAGIEKALELVDDPR